MYAPYNILQNPRDCNQSCAHVMDDYGRAQVPCSYICDESRISWLTASSSKVSVQLLFKGKAPTLVGAFITCSSTGESTFRSGATLHLCTEHYMLGEKRNRASWWAQPKESEPPKAHPISIFMRKNLKEVIGRIWYKLTSPHRIFNFCCAMTEGILVPIKSAKS